MIATARGSIEAEVIGAGTPVLVLHGSPGGIDAARIMSRFLVGFKVILVSRPGYLGTTGYGSIDDEADLLAALLDVLKIAEVGILAWSGAGPPAYRFAVRHPEKVSAIVAIAALSFAWHAPRPSLSQRIVMGTRFGEGLVSYLAKHADDHLVAEALTGEGSVRGEELKRLIKGVLDMPEQRRVVVETAKTVNTSGRRKAGWQNDVKNYALIESLELERVGCPVLLVQGDSDTDVVPEHSRFAHEHIVGSRLEMVKNGTHLAFYADPRAEELQRLAIEWLSKEAVVND